HADPEALQPWLPGAGKQAGRYADPTPRPRAPPTLPASLAELARGDDEALASRVLGEPGELTLPKLPLDIALPHVPAAPTLEAPALPSLPEIRLPRLLDVVAPDVSCAPLCHTLCY